MKIISDINVPDDNHVSEMDNLSDFFATRAEFMHDNSDERVYV